MNTNGEEFFENVDVSELVFKRFIETYEKLPLIGNIRSLLYINKSKRTIVVVEYFQGDEA